ncbi:PP2C family protein-serine/threonine phosphatase [Nonomuraea recticatena]|uniref:PP2C family protein-serine/threonine phosphatase n=1 Tax=Nonomuraea recticatena TaxID=46178 RepID=UPI003618D5BA
MAGASDRGLRHSHNQDAMALGEAEGLQLAVVCDGVTQSPRPESASTLAAQTGVTILAEELKAGSTQESATRAACARAALAVASLATSLDDAPACTYVSAVAGPDLVTVGWVGDSRAYWLPDDGPAVLLTDDDVASAGVLTAWLGADARDTGCRALGFVPDSPGCSWCAPTGSGATSTNPSPSAPPSLWRGRGRWSTTRSPRAGATTSLSY